MKPKKGWQKRSGSCHQQTSKIETQNNFVLNFYSEDNAFCLYIRFKISSWHDDHDMSGANKTPWLGLMSCWVWGLSDAHHEILLAVMSQRFVDDSLQRIIIIRIELRMSVTRLDSIWLLFVIKIPPKHNFLWVGIKWEGEREFIWWLWSFDCSQLTFDCWGLSWHCSGRLEINQPQRNGICADADSF